jgi:hypothetical protein
MSNVNDAGGQVRISRAPLSLILLTAASPLAAIAAILWRLVAMDRGRFAWSEGIVAIVAVAAVAVGFAGGIYLASRRSAWWILASLLSVGIGYIELQVVVAVAWGHMH